MFQEDRDARTAKAGFRAVTKLALGVAKANSPGLLVQTTLRIQGMRTVHCVRAVATALGGVAGITGAQVRLGEAELEHAVPLDRSSIERAIELAGYSVDEIITVRALPLRRSP